MTTLTRSIAAARAITRASQNYTDAKAFAQALHMYTDVLDRRQLVEVMAQLAGLLSSFSDADPFTEQRPADGG
jgi:hypothetical protein